MSHWTQAAGSIEIHVLGRQNWDLRNGSSPAGAGSRDRASVEVWIEAAEAENQREK